MKDPYVVLGVVRGASFETIQARYHALARQYHPDGTTNPALKKTRHAKMCEINSAWDDLKKLRPKVKSAAPGAEKMYERPFYDIPRAQAAHDPFMGPKQGQTMEEWLQESMDAIFNRVTGRNRQASSAYARATEAEAERREKEAPPKKDPTAPKSERVWTGKPGETFEWLDPDFRGYGDADDPVQRPGDPRGKSQYDETRDPWHKEYDPAKPWHKGYDPAKARYDYQRRQTQNQKFQMLYEVREAVKANSANRIRNIETGAFLYTASLEDKRKEIAIEELRLKELLAFLDMVKGWIEAS